MTEEICRLCILFYAAVDVHTKLCQIERKRNFEFNQGPLLCENFAKTTGDNPKLGLVNVDMPYNTSHNQNLYALSQRGSHMAKTKYKNDYHDRETL